MDPNLAALDQVKSMAIDLGMRFGPKLLVAIIIMVAGFYVARWIAGVTGRAMRPFEFEPPVRQLMLNIVRALVLLVFAIMALQNLGVELLPLIAGLGVAGAGIALAMQGVLANLVAGLTIILTRPFRVGEYISIVKEEGQVAEISLASTTLTHPDRSRVVIPNRKVVGEILHNYGQIRQAQVEVRVAYDTDLNQVLAAIREVAKGGNYVDHQLGSRLAAHDASALAAQEADPLSEREREVLRLLALGYTNQEISKKLYISVRTAETHRARIMQKLRLTTRAELVRVAMERGLLTEDDAGT